MLIEHVAYPQTEQWRVPWGKKEATVVPNKYFHIFVNNILHVYKKQIEHKFILVQNIYQIFMELKFGENCRTL